MQMRRLIEPSHLNLWCLQKHIIIACGRESAKEPISKYYVEHIYEHIEKKQQIGREQKNITSWYDYLEQACNDPEGQIRFYRLATKD